MRTERTQGCGKAALLSAMATEEDKNISFSVQEAFTRTTGRLALLMSSLRHKQVMGGNVERTRF